MPSKSISYSALSMMISNSAWSGLAFVSYVHVGSSAIRNPSCRPFLSRGCDDIGSCRKHHRISAARRPRPTARVADAPQLPASTISVKDSATGAKIVLVGCVHGSRVSADDVEKVLDYTTPDAVILELCEPRLNTLRTVVSQTSADGQRLSEGFQSGKRQSFSQLSSTFGGTGPALVAIFLDSVYRLQVLAGVDPGIEFVEPIRRYVPSRIICGDAPAADTVRKLFNVFTRPTKSIKGSLSSMRDLVGRVFLPPQGGINMAALFLTDTARLAEMARLLIPVCVVSTLISVVGNAGAAALDSAPSISGLSGLSGFNDGTSGIVPLVWVFLQAMVGAYLIVSTLRFMKVLISDRDRILTQSILETAAKLRTETDGELVVCAVVGLLHANGILRLLEEHNNTV